MKNVISIAAIVVAAASSIAAAQRGNPEISDPDSEAVLVLSAKTNCRDDCWLRSTSLGHGTAIAIMKGDEVLDQGFMPVPLSIPANAHNPPEGGMGSASVSSETSGVNDAGESGIYVATLVFTYVRSVMRNVRFRIDFLNDFGAPKDEGQNG